MFGGGCMENGYRRNQKKNMRRDDRAERTERTVDEGLVVGRNAVRELLRSGRDIDKILVQKGEREHLGTHKGYPYGLHPLRFEP